MLYLALMRFEIQLKLSRVEFMQLEPRPIWEFLDEYYLHMAVVDHFINFGDFSADGMAGIVDATAWDETGEATGEEA